MAITEQELTAIEGALRERPDGLSMRDLIGPDAPIAKRRNMQRRLQKLIEGGRVVSRGVNKGTRYFASSSGTTAASSPPTPPPTHPAPDVSIDSDDGVLIPLTTPAEQVRKLVQRQAAERDPVTYKRAFLSSYRPNETHYLSQSLRDHLQKIGTVDGQSQPAGTYARHILDRLLIDLAWSSSKLEGNTYSLLDTQKLIEQGKEAEGKSAEETAMIKNHKGAIEFLVDAADDIGFNRYTILNLHSLLADNLLAPEVTGKLREHGVGIQDSVYTPLNNPQVLEECFNELLAKADAIKNPFEQSFFASIHLPYLQPFADVNKRVSRLAANIPFIKRNLAPISFIDVPKQLYVEAMLGVYELNRVELARDMFVWAYERSARRYTAIQQSFAGPDAFRLRYREEMRVVVSEIVRGRQGRDEAARSIQQFAEDGHIATSDRAAFIDAVQAELIGLHEGNFARYKVRPSEFYAWKGAWEGP